MIHAEFFTQADGELTGFRISGHNGSAGEDIVCAAVSSAAYLVANTITDVIQVEAGVTVEDGFMLVRVSPKDARNCRNIFAGFKLHMLGLEEQYPKNIQVSYTEV